LQCCRGGASPAPQRYGARKPRPYLYSKKVFVTNVKVVIPAKAGTRLRGDDKKYFVFFVYVFSAPRKSILSAMNIECTRLVGKAFDVEYSAGNRAVTGRA
jgi:hypothetical protein